MIVRACARVCMCERVRVCFGVRMYVRMNFCMHVYAYVNVYIGRMYVYLRIFYIHCMVVFVYLFLRLRPCTRLALSVYLTVCCPYVSTVVWVAVLVLQSHRVYMYHLKPARFC